jgi:F-type H+-transporting ATPase subunit beta
VTTTTALPAGRIVKVAGPVVDVEFPSDAMPEILYALEVDFEIGGESKNVKFEVAQHIGHNKVRAIALAPTDGLVRGAVVRNTGRRSDPRSHLQHVGGRSRRSRLGVQR